MFVGFTGYRGLSTVVLRLENADSANRLIKHSLQGRIHEKNFIVRKQRNILRTLQPWLRSSTKNRSR
jgi:hypothetical protein